jgi:hypothetical protein
MGFTNVAVSLRAPRATVVIPNDRRWPYFARRALEFLSQTRGGARGTILPLGPIGANPAVIRLLRRYDPDHLLPLMASLTDIEEIQPGVQSLLVDGKPVPPMKRLDFIRGAEEHAPHLKPLLSEEQVSDARRELNTFVDDDGHARIYAVPPRFRRLIRSLAWPAQSGGRQLRDRSPPARSGHRPPSRHRRVADKGSATDARGPDAIPGQFRDRAGRSRLSNSATAPRQQTPRSPASGRSRRASTAIAGGLWYLGEPPTISRSRWPGDTSLAPWSGSQ